MTRKDYVAIAQVFAAANQELVENDSWENSQENRPDAQLWRVLRADLADVFTDDNPRFNRERFYIACEVTP